MPFQQHKPKLLRAEDRVFGGFGHAELHHALGGDLDGLAGGGVAAHASLAIDQNQLAQPGQRKAVLGVLISQLDDADQA